MQGTILLKALILAFCLFSCTYTTDEVYEYHNVPKTDIEASVSINDVKDTVFVFQPTSLKFNVSLNKGTLRRVTVRIDSAKALDTSYPDASLQIDTYNFLKTGVYRLTVETTSTAASGSLADKHGVEEVVRWRKLILKIDVDQPPKPLISFRSDKGFLKIEWTPFLKKSFKNYSLISKVNGVYKEITISDQHQPYWVDSAYVGGYNAEYRVRINTAYKSNGTDYIQYTTPEVLKVVYNGEDSTASLKWNKSLFSKAFKEYQLQEYGTNEIVSIGNVQDTATTIKLKNIIFSNGSSIRLSLVPVLPTYGTYTAWVTIPNPLSAKKIRGTPQGYNIYTKSLLSYAGSNLLMYDVSESPYDSVLNISEYTQLPVTSQFAYYSASNKVVKMNIVTKEKKELSLDSITNIYRGPTNITGTMDGVVSYSYLIRTKSGMYYMNDNVYDFSTKKLLYRQSYFITSTTNAEYTNPILSEDGAYALFKKRGEMFRVIAGTMQSIGVLPVGQFLGFRKDNNNEFFYQVGSEIRIYNTDDLSLNRSIEFPAGSYFVNYDPASHYITFKTSSANELNFVNIETKAKKSLKARGDHQYTLLNGVLFNKTTREYITIFK